MSYSAIGLNFHSSSSPPATAYTTSPVIIAFTLGILICFIVSFCFIYLCRCCFMNYFFSWAFHRPTADHLVRQIHTPADGDSSPFRGLDQALLQIFPTFPYSSVKEFQGKNNKNNKSYSLECAICLLEFEEDSFLRLLTVCCHVFHQECIDLWLESHKTCPVCRTNLDSLSKEKSHQENQTTRSEPFTENNNNDNETRIDVSEEDDDDDEDSRREEEEEVFSRNLQQVGEGDKAKRFSRSHSTGHSIVVIKGGEEEEESDDDDDEKKKEDKYMLKLPEHVQIKLIRGGGHSHTKSCASYNEMAKFSSSKCYYAEAVSGCTTSSQPLRV
ncbi:RING-H2 finger protein ATL29-like [Prosopis cineraria]|uniref:RING-H2 finger protein ATL29-like n=1 Tax=Prosopis cineraria TaxID=364024 RepID=UPI00240F0F7B|nr:RING-H2 finger protein ATL29-like [Prosopis cineraria]